MRTKTGTAKREKKQRPTLRLSPRRAIWCVVAALACAVGGALVYSVGAPPVRIWELTLGRRVGQTPPPAEIHAALLWDLAFILGYGTALYLCGRFLAPAMFRRQKTKHDAQAPDADDGQAAVAVEGSAPAVPDPKAAGGSGDGPTEDIGPEPVDQTEPAPVALALLPLALVGIAADVTENALMWAAVESSGQWATWLKHLTAAAAVLKWACLVPAAAIAVAAAGVTVLRYRAQRGRTKPETYPKVCPPDPLEGDPGARSHSAGPTLADPKGRWLRGFQEPQSSLDAPHQQEPLLGFCLSGGGIRSASVALGALQSLRTELLRARYLVSVSGGGYTAGALQLAVTDASDPAHESTGTRVGTSATVYKPGSVEEDRLRRHARYLADSTTQILAALGLVARVVVLSLLAVFIPALVAGWAAGEFYRAIPLAPVRKYPTTGLRVPDVPTGTWVLLVALVALSLAAYAQTLRLKARSLETRPEPGDRARKLTLLTVIVAAVAVGGPWLIYGAGRLLEVSSGSTVGLGGPVAGVAVTYAVTLVSFLRRKKVVEGVRGFFGKKGGTTVAAVPGGALQLLLVALSLLLLAAAWLTLAGGVAAATTADDPERIRWTGLGLLAALLVLGGLLDQTDLSLHPFYRQRLAAAFAVRRVERGFDRRVVAEGYSYTESTCLDEYGKRMEGDPSKAFPEVVFAAAANLTGERRAPLKAATFTMGARWLGGPEVGYVDTASLRRNVAPAFQRDLTVQAAMAVSGAAFASASGRHTRWYGALLALSGLRLGTWLPNPVFVDRWSEARKAEDRERKAQEHRQSEARQKEPRKDEGWGIEAWTTPGLPRMRRLSYLAREILGIHRWTDRLLQITDGGHYENLGLVEALRRRCTEIYCIDASGDKPPTAGTFAEAVALAYAELGVRITLDDDAWRLVPGSGAPLPPQASLDTLNKRLSERSVLTARICYPEESGLPAGQRHGTLVVAKASLTPRLPYPLLSYAARNEVFPYDSTGDQFFDDGKFIAYSALGRALGDEAEAAMQAARRKRWSRKFCPFCPPRPQAAAPDIAAPDMAAPDMAAPDMASAGPMATAGATAASAGGAAPAQRSSGSPA